MININIEEKDFEKEVLDVKQKVFVKFYAPWCGPCKMQSAILEQIEDEKYNDVKVVNINIDNAPKLAREYGVMSIPTIVVVDSGAEVEKIVGLRSQEQVEELFDKYM